MKPVPGTDDQSANSWKEYRKRKLESVKTWFDDRAYPVNKSRIYPLETDTNRTFGDVSWPKLPDRRTDWRNAVLRDLLRAQTREEREKFISLILQSQSLATPAWRQIAGTLWKNTSVPKPSRVSKPKMQKSSTESKHTPTADNSDPALTKSPNPPTSADSPGSEKRSP